MMNCPNNVLLELHSNACFAYPSATGCRAGGIVASFSSGLADAFAWHILVFWSILI